MMFTPVKVVLVNFNNAEKTKNCVLAIASGSVLPETVCIVDNKATMESTQILNSINCPIPINYIANEFNVGFAAGCNQGILECCKDNFAGFIWLLNNDTIPANTALEELLKTATAEKSDITGAKILDASGKYSGGASKVHPKFASVHRSEEGADFDYIEGSSMLISSDCIKKIGLLPESYFLYFEECDYCYLARQNELKLAWATNSEIRHEIGSSTGSERGKGNVPFFIDCLMIRNRIHFAKKYKFPTTWVYVGLLISLLLRLKRFQFDRVFEIIHLVFSESYFKTFVLKNGGYIK